MRKSWLNRRKLLKSSGISVIGGILTTSTVSAQENDTGEINDLTGFGTPRPITKGSDRFQLITPANRLTIDGETDDTIDLVFEWDDSISKEDTGGRSISGSGVLSDQADIGGQRAIFRGAGVDSGDIVYDRLTLRGIDMSAVEPGDDVGVTVSARQADSSGGATDFSDVVSAVDEGNFDAESTTQATFEVARGTISSGNDTETTDLGLASDANHTIAFDIDQLRDESAGGTPTGPAKGIFVDYFFSEDDGLSFDFTDDDVTLGGAASNLDLEVVGERQIPAIGQVLLEIANNETLEDDAELEVDDTVTVELSGLDTADLDSDVSSSVQVGLHDSATFDPIVNESIASDRGAYTVGTVDFETTGPGTPEKEIEDWRDLDNIRIADEDDDDFVGGLDGEYVLANDLTPETEGYNAVVETPDTGFTPIRFEFTGSFDGQDNTIEGLIIDEHPNDDIDPVGLFNRIGEGGIIKNVDLEGVNVTGEDTVGGLAAEVTGGTLSNISVSGSITILADGGKVGGLVGTLREGTITDSSAGGSVTHNGAGGISSSAGGLIGRKSLNSELKRSSASATVTGEGDGIRAGGLIGTSYGSITDVSASGDVIDESESDTTAGGLIGFMPEGTIKEGSATGNVTGDSVGGCFGTFGNSGDPEAVAIDVSATGEVEGTDDVGGLAGSLVSNSEMTNVSATGSVKGNENVGGLVGDADEGSITEATAAGNVDGIESVGGLVGSNRAVVTACQATGNIESEGSAGGLVGINPSGSIKQSVAAGNVDSTGQSVGGLAGSTFDVKIEDSYAVGNVKSTDGQVGGLVGGNSATIDGCFATGTVEGDFLVGGLVGNASDGVVEDSYWDTVASEQDESPVGEGLTTAQMTGETASDKMANFDFSDTWQTVVENQEINGTTVDADGYPILQTIDTEAQLQEILRKGVEITDISLTPDEITDSKKDHTLEFEAQNVSADGTGDQFEVNFPDNVVLEDYSDVEIEELSEENPVEQNGNTLSFSVNPSDGGSTRISIMLTVTLSTSN